MAWLCQKATEMGISSITPFFAERSQHHYWTAKSAQHMMKIIESAAAQSYQLQLPQLGSVCRLEELSWPNTYQWITADFDGSQWPHGCSAQPLGLLIGPEGGWTSKDKNLLPKEMHVVRLTPTVLRAETAALMCLSLAFLR
jgi:16S rRNA (uracil1498-N3)-methyltransferase